MHRMSEKEPEGEVHHVEVPNQPNQSEGMGKEAISDGILGIVGVETSKVETSPGAKSGPGAKAHRLGAETRPEADSYPQEPSVNMGGEGGDTPMEVDTEGKLAEHLAKVGNEGAIETEHIPDVYCMNNVNVKLNSEDNGREMNEHPAAYEEGAEAMPPDNENKESETSGEKNKGAKPKKVNRKERFLNACFGSFRKDSDSESDEDISPELKEKFKDDKKKDFKFFWKSYSPFSQWYKSAFIIDGIEYNCAEQYMMHQKALLMGDEEKADLIMAVFEPEEQKAIGREVDNFDEQLWKNNCEAIVKKGNMAKFTQNERLQAELIGTFPRILVEASPVDRIWGIGLSSSNKKAHNRAYWKGKNLLGYILTEVRDEIMRDRGMMEDNTPPSNSSHGQRKEEEANPSTSLEQSNNALEDQSPGEKDEFEKVQDSSESIEKLTSGEEPYLSQGLDSAVSEEKSNYNSSDGTELTKENVIKADSCDNTSCDNSVNTEGEISNISDNHDRD